MINDENYIAKKNQTTEIQSQDDAISYGRAEMAKALSEYIESIKNVR